MNLHVVRHPKGWAVMKTGAKRAIRLCAGRPWAIFCATVIQKEMKVPVYIHNSDGSVNCKLEVEV